MIWQKFFSRLDTVAGGALIALGFSIPFSVALDNLLLLAVLVLWLAGAHYREKIQVAMHNPAVWPALALFGLLMAGGLHGAASLREVLDCLGKYVDLAFFGIMVYFFRKEEIRNRAQWAFMLVIALTLALSYAVGFGLLPGGTQDGHGASPADLFAHFGPQSNPFIFKLQITHNLLMAFGAYLFAVAARHEVSIPKRMALYLLALLAIYNVLFMVQGRTGYLIVGALLSYYFFDRMRWKGLVVGLVASGMLAAAAFYGSPSFRDRVLLVPTEALQWQADKAADTSVGDRLDFYRNGLAVFRDHPFFGVGTGSFPRAYAKQVEGTGMPATANPHNEYLLIAIQLGAVGLAALLFLFYRQWRLAALLPSAKEKSLARGLILTMAVGCLFNSLLLDHVEGLFYAWGSAMLFAGLGTAGVRAGEPVAA